MIFIISFAHTFCIIQSFSVHAQSVTGRWKLTDAKETVTDKSTGKTQDLGAQIKPFLNMMQQTITFNADHSYAFSQNMTGSKKALEGSGTYSVSGNQLKLDKAKSNMPDIDKKYLPAYAIQLPPTATIVSQTLTTLVLRLWHGNNG